MADDHRINSYLNELRGRVETWHRDPDDVIAEAADHILERSARLEREGLDADSAVVRAIEEHGTTQQVAEAHLRTARRPAIPTADTRTMGVVAMAAGSAWIALPMLTAVLPDAMPYWAILASLLHLGVAGAVMAAVGIWLRHGGLGPFALLAAVPAALSIPFVLFVWPIPAWIVLLGAASLLFGLNVLFRRTAPMPSTLAFTGGLAISGAAVVSAEFATVSTNEDFAFLASGAAVAVVIGGMMLFGLGLLGLGRWLHSERAVEIPGLPVPTGSARAAS